MAPTTATLVSSVSSLALKSRVTKKNVSPSAKEALKCGVNNTTHRPRTVAQAVPSETVASQDERLKISAVSRRQMLSGGVALAVVVAMFTDARPSFADEESSAAPEFGTVSEASPVAEIAEETTEAATEATTEAATEEAAQTEEELEEEIEEEIAELEERAAQLEAEGETEEAKVLEDELEVIEEELETAPRSFIQQALLALKRSFGL